jgi:hypothetical protein
MGDVKIKTNIFAHKITKDKVIIGDVTIDILDNLLSPFHQVDIMLNGIFNSAENENIKRRNEKEGKNDKLLPSFTNYTKTSTLTRRGGKRYNKKTNKNHTKKNTKK